MKSLRGITLLIAMVLANALLVVGCDNDDGGGRKDHGAPHSVMHVGSTEPGAGALRVDDVPIAFVVSSVCIGGEGEDCVGGTVVYTGTSPGFENLEGDDEQLPIYMLPDGVEVSMEIVAIDPDASVLVSGVLLDEVGETVVINTTPELHNHPTWQIVAPGGDVPADKQITFRLHAESFDPSDEITVTLRPFEDNGGHDPMPTPTATATATAEHHGPPHSIMLVGSTGEDAGALTVDQVPVAFVAESACLGGSGDDCEGGVVVYTGTSPGFDDLGADDPNQPIYVLPEEIEVSIEITAVEAGASVLISGVVLDEVGETAVVNTTGHLHNHPTWTLTAPAGEVPADKQITFRLHAKGFEMSDAIAVVVRLFDENEDGGSHGD